MTRSVTTSFASGASLPPRQLTVYTTGGLPSAPSNVTSVTKDAGATVSFLAPSSTGSSTITSYTITPYISGAAQAPTTIAAGSLGTIAGSNGNTYFQCNVTGLTNSTAYTFSVHASNSSGSGPESGQSGANTPLSGLVFGDDFNGPASGPVDPEWWVYNNRCGYLSQSEVEAYMASHCALDGSGNLKLTAEHVSQTVPRYPSDPSFPGNITQPWTSGACQSNTRTYNPSVSTNTMTFEVRQQVCTDSGNGYWPGLLWLVGSHYLTQWKTDPQQLGWDTTTQAEIDIAEWPSGATKTNYKDNVFCGGSGFQPFVNTALDFSASMHTWQARWKPGVKVEFWRDDGSGLALINTDTTEGPPANGANFFLLIYLQMLAGGPTTTESCLIDYVRVYDQNLG